MVKYILSFLIFAFSAASYANDFSAQITGGRGSNDGNIHLKLELKNQQPESQPDLSVLEKDFQIIGEQSSSVQKIINGNSYFSTVWDLTLNPTSANAATIPSIEIQTGQGVAHTEPVSIQANLSRPSSNLAAKVPSTSPENGISFTAQLGQSQVYKNERIPLTYRLLSNRSLTNLQLDNLEMKDAIIERKGDPTLSREIINGREQNILRASYLVTPLKEGVLVIPPLKAHAQIAEARAAAPRSRFESLFGGDDSDPFAGMRAMMDRFDQDSDLLSGFAQMKNITIASSQVALNVLPPVAGVSPWLPAEQLRISQAWSGGTPRVGEPLTRTVTTEAMGLAPSQIPSFEEQMKLGSDYKVYSDQPQLSEKQIHGRTVSIKTEVFTIIPQKAQAIKLPDLKLTWWNTLTRSIDIANAPGQTLKVYGDNLAAPVTMPASPLSEAVKPSVFVPRRIDREAILMMSMLVAGLFLIAFAFKEFWKGRSHKANALTPSELPKGQDSGARITAQDLANCKSVSDVLQFMQKYGQQNWHLPKYASTAKIFSAAQTYRNNFDSQEAAEITKAIDAALYANQDADVKELKQRIKKLIFDKNAQKRKTNLTSELPEMNPT